MHTQTCIQVRTKYVLNVCIESVYFILKGKINQINRPALKYVYKVDKFYVQLHA